MILLDGKQTSSDIKDEITSEVLQLKKEGKKNSSFSCNNSRK